MKRVKRKIIIDQMTETGLIPVFNHQEPTIAAEVMKHAYQAGVRVFEFTNRGAYSAKVFAHLAKEAADMNGLILGIGTIWNTEEAVKFLDLGAQFVVSPGLIPELGKKMNEAELLWIPGCGTVSEVYKATTLGAKMVKIFPGNVLGADFANAVKSVLPHVKLMPTGGVEPTASNLGPWFRAGVSCVGMGSQLFAKNLIDSSRFTELQDEISDALSLIRSLRANM